jgi:hypothetical protein
MQELRSALVKQYLASLEMLREVVTVCPEELWVSGVHPRNYWRIVYHALYYTHLYLAPDEKSFVPWENHRDEARILWDKPKVETPYSPSELLEYLDLIVKHVPGAVEALDLNKKSSGFAWYPNMGKLDHQLVNLRHLQGHVGQLSDRLMAIGIETDWVGKLKS